MSDTRIDRKFARLKAEGRAAFVTFVMGGDPNFDASVEIIKGLPGAGADIIEIGMPFTDPMADGPAIQVAGLRALAAGASIRSVLDIVREFRKADDETPIVLMGYFNPVYAYGVDSFLGDAKKAGIDGLIIVDLPPEEDKELCLPALKAGVNFIRLATPTTDDTRLSDVVKNTSGFLYYVSIAGTTGAAAPSAGNVAAAVARLRKQTPLPIAVGFGIRTPEQVEEIAAIADGAVVGSALVEQISHASNDKDAINNVLALAKSLAAGVHNVRK